ncbi:putative Zn finger-like uncharacterized protein [Rhodovulum bhavnagarense]|uniref:Putative Zn finger-like uncharacterized protein n=1 Tax=Rhodovulum bhavnagarense TaxID=992286 RepID=A0A4V2SWK0_9RHOB|nr:zinc-ribbon domain-containing protein [Rhodovulum bhavnagarense]TCP62776.1 putative Zn finger-like uncharacterized protein [Rhodovulum bhavnagarense]
MRLTCPNCDAQYEVDDAVIPPEGRDVQCSNCGQTWFEQPGGALDDAGPADPLEAAMAAAKSSDDPPTEETLAAHENPAPAPQRRELDPALADILRQEAELEHRARAAAGTADPVESQPELGLEPAGADLSRQQERIARLRGVAPEDVKEPAGARRDLLPDIEQINSTLDPATARKAAPRAEEEPEDMAARRGFRRGFAIVVMVAAMLVGLYAFAPSIGGIHPVLGEAMQGYVAAVDAWRIWANTAIPGAMQVLTDKLNGLGG